MKGLSVIQQKNLTYTQRRILKMVVDEVLVRRGCPIIETMNWSSR